MGTTIRREPVTTSIPAAPDYRFLNITNFGGIEKSSNPFVVSSNTASDCLNVYVDEDNALSTRPRLNFIQNLIIAAMDTDSVFTERAKPIGVYNLHDGYLLHVIEDDNVYLHKLIVVDDVVVSGMSITGAIDNKMTERFEVFEQEDKIYVLTCDGYMVIENGVMSYVEGYIPTTRIAKNKRVIITLDDGTKTSEYDLEGAEYESYNLLSDRYKESYFWDGSWGTDSVKQFDDDVIENNYIISEEFSIKNSDGSDFTGTIYRMLPDLTDETGERILYFLARKDNDVVVFGIDKDYKIVDTSVKYIFNFPAYLFTDDFEERLICSDNGLSFAYLDFDNKQINYRRRADKNADIMLDGYLLDGVVDGVITDNTSEFLKNTLSKNKRLAFSPDGRVLGYRKNENLIRLWYSTDDNVYYTYDTSITSSNFIMGKSSIYEHFLIAETRRDDNSIRLINLYSKKFNDTAGDITTTQIVSPWNNEERCVSYSINLAKSGTAFSISATINNSNGDFVRSGIWTYPADKEDGVVTGMRLSPKKVTESYSSEKWDSSIFLYDSSENYVYFKNDNTAGRFSALTGEDLSSDLSITASLQYGYSTQSKILGLENTKLRQDTFLFGSTEPLLIVTRKISNLDNFDYDNFLKLQERLNEVKLYKRFDNNTWFASGNYTFHTLYNDPTYIPISSYNDLGESFEPITGLSIVNDNILAAYKRNRIYIITPITIGDELTYSYTETKNIIGNDVVDAPTLTILTEMPILVSYNGIYALNQLENVQSSDRITTLISEAMNPKWLKESSSDIDKCLVLNRLYWTYFILPHKKIPNSLSKDSDYTKIYLLDNRTQSWFYWELPIYAISAMVKDNKTHLITEKGDLFTLETSDIINKFNKELTEYYDVLKQPTLIPWHWTSQILSLNTINYSKRLVDTTFVLTDTDSADEYALNYKFKAFRKNKNAETTELTLTNDIEYVESITKRTMIPRFNFLQFTLSNTEDDQKLNNNKLRLVGLGLKYVLLGGLY